VGSQPFASNGRHFDPGNGRLVCPEMARPSAWDRSMSPFLSRREYAPQFLIAVCSTSRLCLCHVLKAEARRHTTDGFRCSDGHDNPPRLRVGLHVLVRIGDLVRRELRGIDNGPEEALQRIDCRLRRRHSQPYSMMVPPGACDVGLPSPATLHWAWTGAAGAGSSSGTMADAACLPGPRAANRRGNDGAESRGF
jgi:hypothetical protein